MKYRDVFFNFRIICFLSFVLSLMVHPVLLAEPDEQMQTDSPDSSDSGLESPERKQAPDRANVPKRVQAPDRTKVPEGAKVPEKLPEQKSQTGRAPGLRGNEFEFGVKFMTLGLMPKADIYLSGSTDFFEIFRFGAGFLFSPYNTLLTNNGFIYKSAQYEVFVHADVDIPLSEKLNILLGAYAGTGTIQFESYNIIPDIEGRDIVADGDGYTYVAPRIKILRSLNEGKGGGYGFGVLRNRWHGIAHPVLIANSPGEWSVELLLWAELN